MTITARFNSRCKECGGAIAVGDQINWIKGEKGASHAQCPDNPQPPLENTSRRNDAGGQAKTPRITSGPDLERVGEYLKAELKGGSTNEFINSLATQLVTKGGLTRKQIDAVLNRLDEQADKAKVEKRGGIDQALKDAVPAGRYAVNLGTKKAPEWLLCRVWKGDRGSKPIHVYVVRGTEKGERAESKVELMALKRIAKDPGAAAREFGHRTGACSRCGKSLDVNLSRKLGIGPECIKHWYADGERKLLVGNARSALIDAGIEPKASLDNLAAVLDA